MLQGYGLLTYNKSLLIDERRSIMQTWADYLDAIEYVIDLAGEGATGAAEGRGSRVADAVEVRIENLRHAWDSGLPRALGQEGSNA